MATKYSMDALDAETREWTPIALFSDVLPIEALADMGATLWGYAAEGVADLAIVNMDTGEIEWSASVDESCEPWDDCDNDCGFDPYMGCYTDDV